MKEREEKNSGRKKKVRKKSRTTELSITVVLCCLVAVLTVKGISLQQKVNANAFRLSSLDSQIEEEKQRTDDITALKEYMQTDEYIEKTAREKLGMVKDNEILFKESQSK
ncbi:FtsB family cell division protein [Fusicatenibacter sp.]